MNEDLSSPPAPQKASPWRAVITVLVVIAITFVIIGACRQGTISPPAPTPVGTNSPS